MAIEEVTESLDSCVEWVWLVLDCRLFRDDPEYVHLDETLKVVTRSIICNVGLLCNPVSRFGFGYRKGDSADAVESTLVLFPAVAPQCVSHASRLLLDHDISIEESNY